MPLVWLHGASGLSASVDKEDFALVAPYKWYALVQPHSNITYAITNVNTGGTHTTLRMHKLILPGDFIVDHKDGDGLNNRRSNLRSTNHRNNLYNSAGHSNRESKYKGVTRCKWVPAEPWRARITVNGRRIYLGVFPTEEAAAKAYDQAAQELHGEFARLNLK